MQYATLQRCIQDCTDCHRTCLETLSYCLEQEGRHIEAGHIRLLTDCAEICAISVDFMSRRSTFYSRVCGFCAEVCEQCASSCEQFGDDAQMKACADICRRCAQSCRQMVGLARAA